MFIRNIKYFVDNATSVQGGNRNKLNALKTIFRDENFPTPQQTWRSFVDPKTGNNNENYGWFLITFNESIIPTIQSLVDSNGVFEVCLSNNSNHNLCFRNYPIGAFSMAFEGETDQIEVRRFQNIIQPALLEYGFIKSDRIDKRLVGCSNAQIEGGDIADEIPADIDCSGNCRNEWLTNPR